MNKVFYLILLGFAGITGLSSQTIPFVSPRWVIHAKESNLVDYLGQKALYLKGGDAVIKDAELTNGTIEFDIAVSGERGFMGAVWRMTDSANYENFYIRPHQSGNPDANQYTPVFNDIAAWQLYYGDGYAAPVKYINNQWMHIKIVVSGNYAEMYINDMVKPALFVSEMKMPVRSGGVGLTNSNFTGVYFANFQFTKSENPKLAGSPVPPKETPRGTITAWSVSNTFNETALANALTLNTSLTGRLTWKKLECESTGLANLARIQGITDSSNTAFAKVTVTSEKDQIKKIKFGFSDRVKIYCNGTLLYSGMNNYLSRDYRFLGTIGYYDAIHLPLQKGKNEIWMAVSEDFGGWGLQAMIEDTRDITINY